MNFKLIQCKSDQTKLQSKLGMKRWMLSNIFMTLFHLSKIQTESIRYFDTYNMMIIIWWYTWNEYDIWNEV